MRVKEFIEIKESDNNDRSINFYPILLSLILKVLIFVFSKSNKSSILWSSFDNNHMDFKTLYSN